MTGMMQGRWWTWLLPITLLLKQLFCSHVSTGCNCPYSANTAACQRVTRRAALQSNSATFCSFCILKENFLFEENWPFMSDGNKNKFIYFTYNNNTPINQSIIHHSFDVHVIMTAIKRSTAAQRWTIKSSKLNFYHLKGFQHFWVVVWVVSM